MIPAWAEDITEDEIKHPLVREIIETIGIDEALQFVDTFGGANIYVPLIDKVLVDCRDRHIREEYDGTNTKRLATRYGVTDSWVLRIVGAGKKDEGQTDLFGDLDI